VVRAPPRREPAPRSPKTYLEVRVLDAVADEHLPDVLRLRLDAASRLAEGQAVVLVRQLRLGAPDFIDEEGDNLARGVVDGLLAGQVDAGRGTNRHGNRKAAHFEITM
jgi:hypothetical protein